MTEPWITLAGYGLIALVLAVYLYRGFRQLRRFSNAGMDAISKAAMARGRREVAKLADGLDLDAIKSEFLAQCGSCDYGLIEYGCNCPKGDYRYHMSRLVDVLEQMKAAADAHS